MPPEDHVNYQSTGTGQTSRRAFLKTVGVIAGAFALHPLHSSGAAHAAVAPLELPEATIAEALTITRASPMYAEMLDFLKTFKFETTSDVPAVKLSTQQDAHTGLLLAATTVGEPRYGADVALTVNITKQELVAVQSVIGWSLDGLTYLSSLIFDARDGLVPVRPAGRPSDPPAPEPPPVRPRKGQSWSFGRGEQVAAEPTVESGQTETKADTGCVWHYGGCNALGWVMNRGLPICLCAQVSEVNTCQPDAVRILNLDYKETE